MSLSVWLKVNGADKVLAPIRLQLVNLIEEEATVLEVGCGTGDLLFKAADKIKFGLGVDLDKRMIDYAKAKQEREHVEHLKFTSANALDVDLSTFDCATSTLCLHEMNRDVALKVLNKLAEKSRTLLIADYSSAESFLSKVSIELDEMISGHYGNFKKYRASGQIPACARDCGLAIEDEINTEIDGIKIWKIKGRAAD